ncbi:MAG: TlpA family protein disulfide reductase [Rhodospirillales bacterium]|nr:TlpA family protein disulfide reductase [Rhodospirillales bacterium]
MKGDRSVQVVVRRALLAGGIAAAGTVAGLWWLRKPQPGQAGPGALATSELGRIQRVSPPRTPPAVSFLDAQGRTTALSAWRGRRVVLNFWATWCGPCVREMPSLQALAQQSPGLAVVPVSGDIRGAPAVRRFYDTHHITALPVWLDPNGTAAEAMGVPGLPTTFLLGADGTIRGLVEGGADWMTLRQQVLALLA